MSRRHLLFTALAACHLTLVACGAASVRFPSGSGVLGDAIAWYGAMSGAEGTYRFFSPSVGTPVRATFTMTDADGNTRADVLYEGNQEVTLRLIKILLATYESDLRQKVTASWAGKMFARHPDAQRVTIRVEEYQLPTMTEYASGERPFWRSEYEAVFQRRPDAPPKGD